jgi:hypothetical protein
MFVFTAELGWAFIKCRVLFEWYCTEIVYISCVHPGYCLSGLFIHKRENKTTPSVLVRISCDFLLVSWFLENSHDVNNGVGFSPSISVSLIGCRHRKDPCLWWLVLLMFEALKLLPNNNESTITATLIHICFCNITCWAMCAVSCLAHGSSNRQKADSAAENIGVKRL